MSTSTFLKTTFMIVIYREFSQGEVCLGLRTKWKSTMGVSTVLQVNRNCLTKLTNTYFLFRRWCLYFMPATLSIHWFRSMQNNISANRMNTNGWHGFGPSDMLLNWCPSLLIIAIHTVISFPEDFLFGKITNFEFTCSFCANINLPYCNINFILDWIVTDDQGVTFIPRRLRCLPPLRAGPCPAKLVPDFGAHTWPICVLAISGGTEEREEAKANGGGRRQRI